MKKARTLDDLEVYQESLKLVKRVFEICKHPLLQKEYSLCDQIKRSSVSVCANIAEGYGRKTQADFAQFLSISLGSSNETIALLDVIKITYPKIYTKAIKLDYQVLGRRLYVFRKSLTS